MNSVAQRTNTIHIGDLQPGITLIDTYHNREKVIQRVEPYDTFVRLFFENDDEPSTYSIEQLRTRA